jgi:hypothetical protein
MAVTMDGSENAQAHLHAGTAPGEYIVKSIPAFKRLRMVCRPQSQWALQTGSCGDPG